MAVSSLAAAREFSRYTSGSRMARSAFQSLDPAPFAPGEASGPALVVKLAQQVLTQGARRRRERLALEFQAQEQQKNALTLQKLQRDADPNYMPPYQRQSLDIQRGNAANTAGNTAADNTRADATAAETKRANDARIAQAATNEAGRNTRATNSVAAQRAKAQEREARMQEFQAANLELNLLKRKGAAAQDAAENVVAAQFDRMDRASTGGWGKPNQKKAVADSLGMRATAPPKDVMARRKQKMDDARRTARTLFEQQNGPRIAQLEALRDRHMVQAAVDNGPDPVADQATPPPDEEP